MKSIEIAVSPHLSYERALTNTTLAAPSFGCTETLHRFPDASKPCACGKYQPMANASGLELHFDRDFDGPYTEEILK